MKNIILPVSLILLSSNPLSGLQLPFLKSRHQQSSIGSSKNGFVVTPVPVLLDTLTLDKAPLPIIRQWQPKRRTLWKQWKGTVLETSLIPALGTAALSLLVCLVAKRVNILEGIGRPFADQTIYLIERFSKLWHMQLSMVTFFLAFFLNSAKSFYDNILVQTRAIQGNLNDLNLVASTQALRESDGSMTPKARKLCETVGRYTHLFSILFYAAQCRRYEALLGAEGLKGMLERNLITPEENDILKVLPPKKRYNAVFSWLTSTFTTSCESDGVRVTSNTHFMALGRTAMLRASCATLTDLLDTRSPLAYVHLIQLLVDSFLILTPLAAIGDMGWVSIIGTFLLSLFFTGLLDLSKMLFDPLDQETFGSNSDRIQVDTLIIETRDGGSRFSSTGYRLPESARP